MDPPDESRGMVRKLGLQYPILSDPRLEVIDRYGVRHPGAGPSGDIARPATFVLDREGVVRWRDFTDNWRIRLRPERVLEQLESIP